MMDLIYSPHWFYGKDIIIDIVSVLVLFFIGFFSFKYYKIEQKKNQLSLAISFFLISLSFLFKILTNFTIYYKVLETKQIGFVTFTFHTIKSTNTLFVIGFLMYRILTLIGLYMLYSIYKKQAKTDILFIVYLILISTYFSQSAYYIFHLTSLILLILITIHYFRNYTKNKHYTAKLLAYSFSIITISQIVFVFVKLEEELYAAAEIIQLIGYILLLITFIMVLRHGKKK